MMGAVKKRNNKCRNRTCACTGACFVDDGTGDFAPKNALGFRIPQTLTDLMVEDIIEMSDEEIIQEMIEDGADPEKEADRIRAIIDKAVKKAKQVRTRDTDTV